MTPHLPAGRWRGPLRLLAAVLLGGWLLLVAAAPATAHAQLLGTDPADGALLQEAPEQVTLSFSEPVRLSSQEIAVFDAEGNPVASTSRTSGTDVLVELDDPAALGTGTFVVGWFVISADGHPISGSLQFSVGERSEDVAALPTPATSPGSVRVAQGVVGTGFYLGLLTATGLAGFVALVLPASYDGERVRSRIRSLVRGAAGLAAVAAVLSVLLSSVYAQGAGLSETIAVLDLGLVRDEAVSASLVVIGLVVLVGLLGSRPPTRTTRIGVVGAAAVALVGPSLAGHTRSYQPSALLIASDVVHLLAGAAWLGGLVGLVLALRELTGREQLAAATLARFSTIAGGLLLAVAVTGTILGWRIVGSWEALLTTGYGQLLLVKIGLALLVAGFGAWNRFRMLPRVQAAAGFADRGVAATLVTRAVRVEAVVLVVLLAVTSTLVTRSPRPAPVEVPPGRTGVQEGSLSDVEVLVLMSPRQQGSNTLVVQLQDRSGEPLVTRRPPEVTLRSGDLDLGSVPLISSDAGTWTAEVLIPRPGLWQVDVGLRISRFENPVTSVDFEVAPSDE